MCYSRISTMLLLDLLYCWPNPLLRRGGLCSWQNWLRWFVSIAPWVELVDPLWSAFLFFLWRQKSMNGKDQKLYRTWWPFFNCFDTSLTIIFTLTIYALFRSTSGRTSATHNGSWWRLICKDMDGKGYIRPHSTVFSFSLFLSARASFVGNQYLAFLMSSHPRWRFLLWKYCLFYNLRSSELSSTTWPSNTCLHQMPFLKSPGF